MNKEQLLNLLEELNLPKDEYYVLSGASLVIRGIREQAGDLDLCISRELFEQIKDKYDLTEDKKNECGFYHISDSLEDLNTILDFKIKRNKPKDQVDIERIKEYLKNKNN